MIRTPKDARKTHDRVLDAAEEAFHEHGFGRTTLAQIAQLAGLTRGAIYGHFRNKGEVFTSMVERVVLPMEMLIAVTTDPREAEPLERMREVFLLCLRNAAIEPHSRRVFEVLFTKCEYTDEMGPLLERQRNAARDAKARMKLGLQNAIEKGQLPADLDTTRAASIIQVFLEGVLRDWFLGHGSVVLPRDAQYLATACLGILQNCPALRGRDFDDHRAT